MPRRPSNLRKHTVRLYDGDMEALRELFPNSSQDKVLRNILHNFIRRARAASPESRLPSFKEEIEL